MTETSATTRQRQTWAWWGVGAGALGLGANLVADHGLGGDGGTITPAAIEQLDRSAQHIGALLGMLALVCLVLVAAGWRRWGQRSGSESLAVHALPTALLLGAGVLLLAYGFMGGLAEYLPGGINDGNFSPDGLYVLLVINDTAPWFGWWGVLIAAALSAWAGLRLRLLPRWLGAVSAVAVLGPLAIMATSGAVAIAGLIGPLWLVVASAATALRRV